MKVLALMLTLSNTVSAFLFPMTKTSCGCNACALPTVCPPLPLCPPVQSCPAVVECCTTCSCKNKRRMKRATENIAKGIYVVHSQEDHDKAGSDNRQKRDASDEVVKVDAKCNSMELRDIIIENVDRVTSISKIKILDECEKRLDGRYNVICARGDLSYITNTEEFCQQTVGDVTCYVFKQLSDTVRSRL